MSSLIDLSDPSSIKSSAFENIDLKDPANPIKATATELQEDEDWEVISASEVRSASAASKSASQTAITTTNNKDEDKDEDEKDDDPFPTSPDWEDIKILERATKSLVDGEDWQITSFGGRVEKTTWLKYLRRAVDKVAEETVEMIGRAKHEGWGYGEDLESLMAEKEMEREALERALEVLEAGADE